MVKRWVFLLLLACLYSVNAAKEVPGTNSSNSTQTQLGNDVSQENNGDISKDKIKAVEDDLFPELIPDGNQHGKPTKNKTADSNDKISSSMENNSTSPSSSSTDTLQTLEIETRSLKKNKKAQKKNNKKPTVAEEKTTTTKPEEGTTIESVESISTEKPKSERRNNINIGKHFDSLNIEDYYDRRNRNSFKTRGPKNTRSYRNRTPRRFNQPSRNDLEEPIRRGSYNRRRNTDRYSPRQRPSSQYPDQDSWNGDYVEYNPDYYNPYQTPKYYQYPEKNYYPSPSRYYKQYPINNNYYPQYYASQFSPDLYDPRSYYKSTYYDSYYYAPQ